MNLKSELEQAQELLKALPPNLQTLCTRRRCPAHFIPWQTRAYASSMRRQARERPNEDVRRATRSGDS